MNSAIQQALPEGLLPLCFVAILLCPLAVAGLALINAGLGRSRNAGHSMLSSFGIFFVALAAYFVCGFAWQGFSGGSFHSIHVAGKVWNLIGSGRFFLKDLQPETPAPMLVALFQMVCVGLTALIPLGGAAERWRLSGSALSTAILAGWIYPVFAHWVWASGWLAQLGFNYGLGRGFIDIAGSGTVHAVGGLTALSVTWILGPRRGKYSHEGIPAAIPGHDIVLVLLGSFLAIAGWLGLNIAGSLLLGGIAPGAAPLVAINTLLSAAFAGLAAAFFTRVRFGKPDASLCVNGCIGGLVASSAACAWITPLAAAVIGAIAGTLVTYSVELFELHLRVDDPGGAISVHAICGIWGLLTVALLGKFPGAAGGARQWLAQIVGIATLLGFVLPMSYVMNWLLNRVVPLRVVSEAERHGLDLHELGTGAYPEFVTHTDEYHVRG
jgi:ammonium transporter, Amt family